MDFDKRSADLVPLPHSLPPNFQVGRVRFPMINRHKEQQLLGIRHSKSSHGPASLLRSRLSCELVRRLTRQPVSCQCRAHAAKLLQKLLRIGKVRMARQAIQNFREVQGRFLQGPWRIFRLPRRLRERLKNGSCEFKVLP